jgi:hypothetical protein
MTKVATVIGTSCFCFGRWKDEPRKLNIRFGIKGRLQRVVVSVGYMKAVSGKEYPRHYFVAFLTGLRAAFLRGLALSIFA